MFALYITSCKSALITSAVGFLGVLVGSFIPFFQEYLRFKKQNKIEAQYLAVRVVCILDSCIFRCNDIINDDGKVLGEPATRHESGQHYCKPLVKLLEPPTYPKDINWKSIDNNLMYRILKLDSCIESINKYIEYYDENLSMPGSYEPSFNERSEQYSQLREAISEIVEELISTYKIQR